MSTGGRNPRLPPGAARSPNIRSNPSVMASSSARSGSRRDNELITILLSDSGYTTLGKQRRVSVNPEIRGCLQAGESSLFDRAHPLPRDAQPAADRPQRLTVRPSTQDEALPLRQAQQQRPDLRSRNRLEHTVEVFASGRMGDKIDAFQILRRPLRPDDAGHPIHPPPKLVGQLDQPRFAA